MRSLFILIFLVLSASAFADELTGAFTETGSDTGYTVNIQNDKGHVYNGLASELSDGTLKVYVSDGAGDNYTGFATIDADNDGYDLHLNNPRTGNLSTGNVDVNEF